MANRYFQQFQLSIEKQVVSLFGKVAIGASGAPTLDTAMSKGIASISRSDTGDYTITLQDTYYKFLCSNFQFLYNGASNISETQLVSEAVNSTKVITITTLDFAGAAADPTSGSVLYFELKLRNSSV
jgi:hypothetical protein